MGELYDDPIGVTHQGPSRYFFSSLYKGFYEENDITAWLGRRMLFARTTNLERESHIKDFFKLLKSEMAKSYI